MSPRCWRSGRCPAGMGAVVCFLGVVRGTEGNASISALEYEVVPAHG